MSQNRRIYIGGLFEGAREEDIRSRFGICGKITSIEIRTKKDASGQIFRTFGYMNVICDDASFKKCVRVFHNSNWKGSTLQIQEAKTSHLDTLKNEQNKLPEIHESAKTENEQSMNKHVSQPNGKQWVKTKDRKELPIMNIRQNDKSKVLQFDPRDYPKRVKKFDDEDEPASVSQLTWDIPEQDSDSQTESKAMKQRNIKSPRPVQYSNKSRNRDRQRKRSVDSDRASDSSDSDSNGFAGKRAEHELKAGHQLEVSPKRIQKLTHDFEVVGTATQPVKSNVASRKRSRFDSSSDEESDVQIATETNRQKKTNKKTPRQTERVENKNINVKTDIQAAKSKHGSALKKRKQNKKSDIISVSSSDEGPIPEEKAVIQNIKGNLTTQSVHIVDGDSATETPIAPNKHNGSSVKPINLDSDSESDVPDIDCWITKSNTTSKRSTKNETRRSNISTDRSEKQPNSSKDQPAKPKQPSKVEIPKAHVKMASSHLPHHNDEFSAGLMGPSVIQAPPPQSNVIGDGDRGEDLDDGDLLDAIASQDWQKVQRYEAQAKREMAKGSRKASSVETHEMPTKTTRKDIDSTNPKQLTSDNTKIIQENEKKLHENAGNITQSNKNTAEDKTIEKEKKPKREKKAKDASAKKTKKAPHLMAHERKQKADDKRREALLGRKQESQRHSNLIKAALSSVDKQGKTNKIVFDSSDEEDVKEISAPVEQQSEEQNKGGSGLALFEEDASSEDEDQHAFAIKHQFEGKSGNKLMKLQARIGTADDRFKMDTRFAKDISESSSDEESDSNTEVAEVADAEQERRKNMDILEGVVGYTLQKNKKQQKYKDMSMMRYDPTREDHQQYEIKPEATPKSDKKKKKEKQTKHEEEKEAKEVLPEVSSDKFVSVSESLHGAFKVQVAAGESQAAPAGAQQFSLLSMFGDEEGGHTKSQKVSGKATAITKQVMPWQDTMDYSSEDEPADKSTLKSDDTKTKVEETTCSLFSSSVDTFFFTPGDSRLKEGLQFFSKTDYMAPEDWKKKREELIQSYRAVHKKAMREVKEKERLAEQLRSRQNRPKGKKGFKRGPKNFAKNRVPNKMRTKQRR